MYNLNSGYGQITGQFPFIGSGKVFIVGDSSTANRDMLKELFGVDPDGKVRYFATLDAAVGECASNAGDYIYVMPGHSETVTATSIALDVAGITIVNLGNGKNQPVYTYTAATSTITVSAANIKFIGGYHTAHLDNVATAFTLSTAKDFVLEGGTFVDETNALHFISIVTTGTTSNTIDGLTVFNNKWYALAVVKLAFVSILATTDRIDIYDNYVNSASTSNVGHFLTLATKNVTNARIDNNDCIVVGATNATVGIFLTGSGTACTGVVSNNRTASLDTTTELVFTAGTKLKFYNNLYTGVADKSGYVLPEIDTSA